MRGAGGHRRARYCAATLGGIDARFDRRTQIALALVLATAIAGTGLAPRVADATHTLPRGISIHYDNGRFEGRLKSPADPCLAGSITLRKVKRGPNPVIGTDAARRGGKWAVRKSARRGRFYAETGSFQTALGRCPAVRTRVLELG